MWRGVAGKGLKVVEGTRVWEAFFLPYDMIYLSLFAFIVYIFGWFLEFPLVSIIDECNRLTYGWQVASCTEWSWSSGSFVRTLCFFFFFLLSSFSLFFLIFRPEFCGIGTTALVVAHISLLPNPIHIIPEHSLSSHHIQFIEPMRHPFRSFKSHST